MLILSLTSCVQKEIDKTIKFDSKKWKNWEESESSLFMRSQMATDIINRDILKNKSFSEVIELLGEKNQNCKSGNCKIYYSLGPCQSGIDYASLIIQFENNMVKKIEKKCH